MSATGPASPTNPVSKTNPPPWPEPMPTAAPRYAVYWAPAEDHPLWAAGCIWLGRDPADARRFDGPPPPGRAEPWHYGFHATLKPPMRLRADRSLAGLQEALARVAAGHAPLALGPLQVATIGDAVALRLAHTPPALQALADACVLQVDDFRAPPTESELARRTAGLDAEQQQRLARWGYPHVLAGWRFHMTLSNALPDHPARAAVAQAAARRFAWALTVPLSVQDICLFEEPAPGQPLHLLQRFALGA